MLDDQESLRWDLPFPRTGCNLTCSHNYTKINLAESPYRSGYRSGDPTHSS